MRLNVIKKQIRHTDIGNYCLFTVYNSDKENLKYLASGEIHACELKRERNLKQHNMYFALCALVADNTDNFNSKDEVDYYIRIKCGLVDFQIICEDKTIVKPKSLQFAKMSQEKFEYFFDKALQVMCNILGTTEKELLTNYMEYM